jgi:hypothetical protein
MAFYRRDVSKFALSVWWSACEPFDMEQVAKALTAHAMDPEQGRFPPMPADIVKQLAGTKTDRAIIAWGKAYGAISAVGGYSSVAFDDAVIHAVIEDMGGWPKFCVTMLDELPFVQKRFCETYRAYVTRGDVPYAAVLSGVHAINNARFDRPSKPVLIGDPIKAASIATGPSIPRAQITHIADALMLTQERAA